MKYLKRRPGKWRGAFKNNFKSWELNFLFTLIILLVMATIVDLNLTFDQILKFFSH